MGMISKQYTMYRLWVLVLLTLAACGSEAPSGETGATASSLHRAPERTAAAAAAATASEVQKRGQETVVRGTGTHRQTVSARSEREENSCAGVTGEEQCEGTRVEERVVKEVKSSQTYEKPQSPQLVEPMKKSYDEESDQMKLNSGKREEKPFQEENPSLMAVPKIQPRDKRQQKETQSEEKANFLKQTVEKSDELKQGEKREKEVNNESQPSRVKPLPDKSDLNTKSVEINQRGEAKVEGNPSLNKLKLDEFKEAKDSVRGNSAVNAADGKSANPKITVVRPAVKSKETIQTEGKNAQEKPSAPSKLKPPLTKPSEIKPTHHEINDLIFHEETLATVGPNVVKSTEKLVKLQDTPVKQARESPTQTKPNDGKSSTDKLNEVKPGETKANDAKPVTMKPNEVKPREVKRNEEKPREVKNEIEPKEVKPDEVKPNIVKPNEVKPNEEKPKEVKQNEVKPKEVKPNEVKQNGVKPNEVKPNKLKQSEVKPNEVKSNGLKPRGSTLNTAKPSTVKLDEPKPPLHTDAGSGRAERPARILAVVPYNARSHFVFFSPLFRTLAERGHRVDVVSHFPTQQPPEGYRDIAVNGSFPSFEDAVDLDLVAELNAFTDPIQLWYETLEVCSNVLEHPLVKQLLRSTDNYDLVISEVFGAECLMGFAHKFNAPLVGLISSVAPPASLARVGNPEHPAYMSNYFLPYVPPLSFWQRTVSALYSITYRRLKTLLCDRATDAIGRRYFGEGLPATEELAARTSLVLINSHPAVNQPRPHVPGAVEVGGMHIGKVKPLPEAVARVVSRAVHGVVVVSLGTMVRLASFPPERLAALWAALGALPQTVIVKSKDALPGAPPLNVHAFPWLPQFDLLSHPRTRLFLWHGGLLGAQEAVAAGVPMLGMPLFADQRLNVNALVAKGAALLLEHHDLSRERLTDALHALLNNPSYRESAGALQRQFLDRPQAPLEAAVWWVEYVLRHEGALHLRSAAADMPTYQLLLLDVVAAVGLVIIAAGAVVWITLSAVYRAIRFGSTRPQARLPTVDSEGRAKRYSKTKQH